MKKRYGKGEQKEGKNYHNLFITVYYHPTLTPHVSSFIVSLTLPYPTLPSPHATRWEGCKSSTNPSTTQRRRQEEPCGGGEGTRRRLWPTENGYSDDLAGEGSSGPWCRGIPSTLLSHHLITPSSTPLTPSNTLYYTPQHTLLHPQAHPVIHPITPSNTSLNTLCHI